MKLIGIIFCLATSCLFCFSTTVVNPNIRIGLDNQSLEWTIILEGGGDIQDRDGKSLLCLKDGEKVRIWLDSNGDVPPVTEFRIQVGPSVAIEEASVIMRKLQALEPSDQPEIISVPDGGSWRIVLGHYKNSKDAASTLNRLSALGYQELWIVTERTKYNSNSNHVLYAVTERYERQSLPIGGVILVPTQKLAKLVGKGRYRGYIEIFPNNHGRLSAVNIIDLENYLRGVVPMEMSGGNFPELEALKAQAVAARTYAFTNLGKRAKDGFDLVDTVSDQVYGGRDKEQELTDQAIRETSGLIATYNGLPIQALFMANAGGATVDNSFVFGGACNYLKGVSNYAKVPQTIMFTGTLQDRDSTWLTWEILKLVGVGLLPQSYLETKHMNSPALASDLYPILESLTARLGHLRPSLPCKGGSHLYLWIGRALGFQWVADGVEHYQDAAYLLGESVSATQDRLLASFLTRRGLVSPASWRNQNPTIFQLLQFLGKLWYELEPVDFSEGTLLRNSEIRVKNGGSKIINSTSTMLLAEEAPGGSLQLVSSSKIQVGDRIKWLQNCAENCSILVRRLDPNGAAMNRYNSAAHWKAELKESDLLENLRTKTHIRSLRDIKLDHNDQGRVIKLQITDELGQSYQFTGMRIRELLGLRDNIFRLITIGKRPNRRWIVYGRGWGHGVGMDQTGAYGMALEGANFKEILQHYYQGIQFATIGS